MPENNKSRVARYGAKIIKILLLSWLFAGHHGICAAEEVVETFEWRVITKTDTVTVYEGKKHKSGIIPIKFDAIINFPPARVRSVLSDTERRPDWVPKLVEARIIERVDQNEKTEYLRYDFPWPFFDRTIVLHSSTSFDPDTQTLYSNVRSIDHPNVSSGGNYVRAHTHMGTTLTRPGASEGQTYLEAMFLTDMKGILPMWILHSIQIKWPEKIVENLSKQLAREDIVVLERWKQIDVMAHDVSLEE